MDCLMFSGANSAGKSSAIIRLKQKLLSAGFKEVESESPDGKDFLTILEGKNTKEENIRILIISGTEFKYCDCDCPFRIFFGKVPFDIVICAIRDANDPLCNEFWDALKDMNISFQNTVEIPLVHINGNKKSFGQARNGYFDSIDKLTRHILTHDPFCLL